MLTFKKKESNEYQNESNEIASYIKDIGSLYLTDKTQRLLMDDMIIIMDKESNLDVIAYK